MAEWRALSEFFPDLEGYDVSDDGRIRSYHRGGRTWDGERHGFPVEIKLSVASRTHKLGARLRVASGGYQRFEAHVLVARAFLGEQPTGTIIDFVDRNYANTSAKNLEYVSRAEGLRRLRAYEKCVAAGVTAGRPWLQLPRELKPNWKRMKDLRDADGLGGLEGRKRRQELLSRYLDGGPEDPDLVRAGLVPPEPVGSAAGRLAARLVTENDPWSLRKAGSHPNLEEEELAHPSRTRAVDDEELAKLPPK